MALDAVRVALETEETTSEALALEESVQAGTSGEEAEVAAINTGNVAVYTSENAGEINYVGITNNIERRAAEQLASKGINIEPIQGLQNLSRADARAVEQVLIEENGGVLVGVSC